MRDYSPNWQKILADGFSSVQELLKYLGLSEALGCVVAENQFKTRVPRRFAALMEAGNPRDPLLLQVLATHQELEVRDGFAIDPLEETLDNPAPGVLHKYPGRILLTLTGACAIHCRYCFRRHFPYQDNNPRQFGGKQALDYITNDPSIHEVILSGGDPLLLSDQSLGVFFENLSAIPHLHTVRFHTRVPVVLPERIDTDFLKLLSSLRLKKVVVLHSNHPRELDDWVKDACRALWDEGCQLLNQSVLLKGINNDVHVLSEMSERLFACGVLPYYIHLLDKVHGVAHFEVSSDEAKIVHRALQSRLPGYLVPRLVREIPGEKSKTFIA